MISTSIKQMMAWAVAFGLSGGFFLGCFAALKHLPSKASSSQSFSANEEGHPHSSHQVEHAAGSHAEH
jgi:hypothetical protein